MAYKSENKASTKGSQASDKGQVKTVRQVEKGTNSAGICFPMVDHPDLSKVRGPRG